jgi:ADP-ribose pyrophosphatase YjhB (NUDIX family)
MHSNLPVAVVSVVIKDGKILLLQRKNTPWMN